MSSMAVLLISAYKFTVKYCYNSKCEDFSCFWGILRIRRNIQAELDLDTQQRTMDAQQSGGGAPQDSQAAPDEEQFDFQLDRSARFMERSSGGGGPRGTSPSIPLDDDDIV